MYRSISDTPFQRINFVLLLMYKLSLFNHIRAVKAFVQRYHGEATVNVNTCELEIRIEQQIKRFSPQFNIRLPEGKTAYSPHFNLDVVAFIGWWPYQMKRWEMAIEKLKLKEYLIERGIPTPAYSTDPEADMQGVIIKKSQGSFGENIKGPFRSSKQCRIDSSRGEYYEQFIMGKIAKIWYWNAFPVILELIELPKIRGDGSHTIHELYEAQRAHRSVKLPNVEEYADLLALQGKTLESVLDKNESVALDFKYLSPLIHRSFLNSAELCDEQHFLYPQLTSIGDVLWQVIPSPVRQNTVYTVDAMLNTNGILNVLEMNSNPQLHPDIYATMLEGLFFNRLLRHQVNPPKMAFS